MTPMLALAPMLLAVNAPAPDPRGQIYLAPPPMHATVSTRLMPQVETLVLQLLREKRGMTIDGVRVFESGDKFLPGKIAAIMAYRVLALPKADARLDRRLQDFADMAEITLQDTNDSWGIYYYISALHSLRKAGLLDRALRPATLAALRTKLDWRRFVRPDLTLIDLPNNYYGVAFPVARLRHLLGWEDASASEQLLARTLEHYRKYSGEYGFADETEGKGRFDRYSVLLVGEIAQRMIETGMTPPPEVRQWLRRSVDLMLPRFNLRGEGWEYGRSIGAYGETAFLETLTAAATLKVLTPQEERMAYAFSARIAARYTDFWIDPATGSVDLWNEGRRTDAYRGKHRIFGENLSLARQYIYTDAIWSDLGYRGRAPDPGYARWLSTLPAHRFTWFARGQYDRGVLTLRDRGQVLSLPIINGAEGQHMHSPYFPVPFAPGMLQGSPDATWPQLLPRITLKDGSVLMPLAFFKDVRVNRQGGKTTVTWRQDVWDRMGGKDAVADPRLSVETRYIFTPGHIVREDRVVPNGNIGAVKLDVEFGSFSTGATSVGDGETTFAKGAVTRFATQGYGACTPRTTTPAYAATTGPMNSVVGCTRSALPNAPFNLRWELSYNP
ncbi:hypothetical protein [Sphingomonas sp. S2-65]|uniref:hypothetical protein n=1 Tax=Sphingomonas sp. S2-65 TaxID=2903960 RepID=UPI001F21F7DB|nr:hypothetical protein [Sphingomonas sp. S2-65]UYY60055.1 hypothetical protein LZ586_08210 [Sphingomonas sp. S2-65]